MLGSTWRNITLADSRKRQTTLVMKSRPNPINNFPVQYVVFFNHWTIEKIPFRVGIKLRH